MSEEKRSGVWVNILDMPTGIEIEPVGRFQDVKFLDDIYRSAKRNDPDAFCYIIRWIFQKLIDKNYKEEIIKWQNEKPAHYVAKMLRNLPPNNKIHKDHYIQLLNDKYIVFDFAPHYLIRETRDILERLKLADKCAFFQETKYSNTDTANMNNTTKQEQELFQRIDELLDDKRQVVLYGPPGTGKTYTAKNYIKSKSMDEDHVRRCTFHPEYGYEHFIEGYRPKLSNGQIVFERVDGVFKELCDRAKNDNDPDASYYLLIDEINRGDIPRIFGELITLIEKDKRNQECSVILSLSKDSFYVPSNVYIIATMNTADRSIALLDSALRRRFGFIEMKPEYHHFTNVMTGRLKKEDGVTPCDLADWFKGLNDKLSQMLANQRHDVDDILIGHSYFIVDNIEKRFERILCNEIYPLLKEYCYDDKKTYETLKEYIRNTTCITPKGETLKNVPSEDVVKPQSETNISDTTESVQA